MRMLWIYLCIAEITFFDTQVSTSVLWIDFATRMWNLKKQRVQGETRDVANRFGAKSEAAS
jgi:hypothetical protein